MYTKDDIDPESSLFVGIRKSLSITAFPISSTYPPTPSPLPSPLSPLPSPLSPLPSPLSPRYLSPRYLSPRYLSPRYLSPRYLSPPSSLVSALHSTLIITTHTFIQGRYSLNQKTLEHTSHTSTIRHDGGHSTTRHAHQKFRSFIF